MEESPTIHHHHSPHHYQLVLPLIATTISDNSSTLLYGRTLSSYSSDHIEECAHHPTTSYPLSYMVEHCPVTVPTILKSVPTIQPRRIHSPIWSNTVQLQFRPY
jgi:hypothetical protein